MVKLEEELGASPSPNQEQPPSQRFFKIILPVTLQNKKLRIPGRFARKCVDELSDVVEVIVPGGNAWEMGVTKANNNVWFDDGWQTFLEHHSIAYGHVLVFNYKGFSSFSVRIFDRSGCEIEYPCRGPTSTDDDGVGKRSRNDHDGCEIEDDDDDDVVGGGDDDDDDVADDDDDDDGGDDDDDHHHHDSIRILGSTFSPSCSLGAFVGSESKRVPGKRHTPLPEQSSCKKRCLGSVDDSRERKKLGQLTIERHKTCTREVKTEVPANVDCANESRKGKLLRNDGTPSRHAPMFNMAKEKSISNVNVEYVEIIYGGKYKALKESNSAVRAAMMFKSKNPSFMVILQKYNILGYFVHVPSKFTRYMEEVSQSIALEGSDGQKWSVRVGKSMHGRLHLGKGWRQFSRDHKLKEGDVCVFELTNKENFVLKVSIFPVVEDTAILN